MRLSSRLQYLLPHRFLSRLVYWGTRWTWRPWKNFLIATVVKQYSVDMREAAQTDPLAFPFFNAFFTRALKAGARSAPSDPAAIACPADGRISQLGAIVEGRLLQAKGRDYSVAELIGDEKTAERFRDGRFITIYLSPRDYHRVHAPLDGALRETLHIPGRIFSVAPGTVEDVPNLFSRNERLVCHFDGEHGPFCVILVGAMLVSGIETIWDGVEVPPYATSVVRKSWSDRTVRLMRFDELGRFNMGSTVIVLIPPGGGELDPNLLPESSVKVGQMIGRTG
ncbi:MAG TPA: archaetidylserine decarboxylase [Rudaea sp.]|nr:archaetidylserine decarboxylase [Rudaea sp.]